MNRQWIDRDRGFLVGLLGCITRSYMDYLSVWSTTGLFHRSMTRPATGRVVVHQDNRGHDLALLLASSIPIVVYWRGMRVGQDCSAWPLLGVGFCAWWCIDRAISSLIAVAFGFKNNANRPERLSYDQARRRIVLKLCLFYPSLVFAYANVLWWMALSGAKFAAPIAAPSDALQLSFSTMTTIGYGTFAPADVYSILVCMCAAGTALLNLGASLSVLAAMVKVSPASPDSEPRTVERKEISAIEYDVRLVLPVVFTCAAIAFLSREASLAFGTKPTLADNIEYRVVPSSELNGMTPEWQVLMAIPENGQILLMRK